jgi:hypothetical protein
MVITVTYVRRAKFRTHSYAVIVKYVFQLSQDQSLKTVYKCPISPGPQENSVIWQNRKKCKEGKVVANHMFQSQMLEYFTYDELLQRYTLYIINTKAYGDVASCYSSRAFTTHYKSEQVIHVFQFAFNRMFCHITLTHSSFILCKCY